MQQLGSAITYARRYGLMLVCGVAPADDDDGNGSGQRAPRPRQKAPSPPIEPGGETITADEAKNLVALAAAADVSMEAILGKYQIASLREFPASRYDAAVAALTKKAEEVAEAAGREPGSDG